MLNRICFLLGLMASMLSFAAPPEGRMELRLRGALYQTEPDRLRDFRLELILEDGQWQPVHGSAWTFNKATHAGDLRHIDWDGDRLRAELLMDVRGDQWVPGGEAAYRVELARQEDGGFQGSFTGSFRDTDMAGEAVGTWFAPRPRLADAVPLDPAERPRILFRPHQLEALQAKAQSDWGRAMLERLRASNHAVAFGLLYQLEGRPEDAARAQALGQDLFDKRELGGVNNYPNPMGERLGLLAMTYDLSADAWDAEFRERMAGHLRHFADRATHRPHTFSQRMNYSPAADTHGAMRGGGAVASLALEDNENTLALQRVALRHIQDYFEFSIGDGGWQSGGETALAAGVSMPAVFALAWRNLHGVEPSWRSDISLLAPRHLMQAIPQADGGFIQQSDNLTDGPLTAGLLAHLFALSEPRFQPALKTFWDRLLARGYPTDGLELALTFVHYPLDMEALPPDSVLPKIWEAPTRGGFVFRNTWADENDIVLQFFGKTKPVVGWEMPRAGDIVLHGLGHAWGVRGAARGRDWTRRHHNVVLLPQDRTLDMQGIGRITRRELGEDRASLTLNLDMVHQKPRLYTDNHGRERQHDPFDHNFYPVPENVIPSGISAHRALAVDLSGASGTPLAFAVADHISGGQAKIWQWQLDPRNLPEVVIEENRFHLRRPDGSSLTATFLKPEGVQIRTVGHSHEAPLLEGRTDARPSQRPAIHAWAGEQATVGDFLVVITLQRGDAPPVQTVSPNLFRIGGLELRVDADQLNFKGTP